jgi:ribosomal-protein-alanine N-acetyltransferase
MRGWPAAMSHGRVGVRALRRSDANSWHRLRAQHADWLGPWEASLPQASSQPPMSYRAMVSALRARARAGQVMPFVITYDGAMVGMLTVNGIIEGSSRSASLGYWIARTHAGQSVTSTAVALVCDHLFNVVQLHRVEIAIRPENERSLRIVERLGFTEIGLAPGYLHIAGQWRDHRLFQLLADDVQGRVIDRIDQPQ